jgi:hypothetical protein
MWLPELIVKGNGDKAPPVSSILARGHSLGIVPFSIKKDVRFRQSSFLVTISKSQKLNKRLQI